MQKMKYLGYDIEYNSDNNEWIYSDNKQSTKVLRPCKHCGKLPTNNGHDFCIADLPNVKHACCGHGVKDELSRPYAILEDNTLLEFDNKEELLKYFGRI